MNRLSGRTREPAYRTPPSPPDETRRRGSSPLEFAIIVFLCLGFVFGVIRPFVAEILFIPSGSMAPTLEAGDRVLTDKLAYRVSEPQRGELAVFEAGDGLNAKRVAGLAGDTVEIRDGVLHVNGEPRRESYVDYRLNDGNFFGPETVPEGHVFVLGDNRSNSLDSRSLGPIPEESLVGEVRLRVWPLWPPDVIPAEG